MHDHEQLSQYDQALARTLTYAPETVPAVPEPAESAPDPRLSGLAAGIYAVRAVFQAWQRERFHLMGYATGYDEATGRFV